MKEIPVFFTIDENYAPYLAVAINSIIKNASRDYQYRIIVLHQDVTDETVQKIRKLETDWVKMEFIPMQQCYEQLWGSAERIDSQITDHISNRLRADYFTMTIYFRLFIPDLFPQYDKGIYLDSDIVVLGDISEMYNIDLGDNLLGVCLDLSIHDTPELVHYITDGVGVGKENYFNSGILLMNLKRLREVRLGERFLEVHKKWEFDCIAPDQDYLNALCFGHVMKIDPRWDTMPNRKQPEIRHPLLIHYNLFEKPWMYDGIQYSEYFWDYAYDSGYWGWLLEFKSKYSKEKQQADMECLTNLVARGEKIATVPGNFREVFNGGKEKRLCD